MPQINDALDEFYRRVDDAVARAVVVTPTAVKRGRFPNRPYVPVMALNRSIGRAKTQQIKGRAFATREEAVAFAARQIERLKERYRKDFLSPQCRALRKHYGLPVELPDFVKPGSRQR